MLRRTTSPMTGAMLQPDRGAPASGSWRSPRRTSSQSRSTWTRRWVPYPSTIARGAMPRACRSRRRRSARTQSARRGPACTVVSASRMRRRAGRSSWVDAQERLPSGDDASQIAAIHRSQPVVRFRSNGPVVTANRNVLDLIGCSFDEDRGKDNKLFVESRTRAGLEYTALGNTLRRGPHRSSAPSRETLGKPENAGVGWQIARLVPQSLRSTTVTATKVQPNDGDDGLS